MSEEDILFNPTPLSKQDPFSAQRGTQNLPSVDGQGERSPESIIAKQSASASGNQEPAQPCATCKVVLRIGVFFDGTNNSKYNTSIKKSKNDNNKESEKIDTSRRSLASYGNDYTNIPKLSIVYPEHESSKTVNGETYIYGNVYTDGAGTLSGREDSWFWGTGGDIGPASAIMKVGNNSRDAFGFAKKYVESKKVDRIEVDIYGFSRGATSARDFANKVYQLKGIFQIGKSTDTNSYRSTDLDGMPYLVIKAETVIKFIGLFDTVSTYGVNKRTTNIPSQTNLHENIAQKEVYQLVAIDEPRSNFSLISILNKGVAPNELPRDASIKQNGNFKEHYVYGAHADIGGGYNQESERSVISQGTGDGKKELQAAVQSSPVPETIKLETTPAETYLSGDGPRRSPERYKVVSSRDQVRNDLPIVYLHMMRDESVKMGVPFAELTAEDTKLAPDLKNVPEKLKNGSSLTEEERKAIRDGTHVSSKEYESTNDYGLEAAPGRKRVIHPNDENPRWKSNQPLVSDSVRIVK